MLHPISTQIYYSSGAYHQEWLRIGGIYTFLKCEVAHTRVNRQPLLGAYLLTPDVYSMFYQFQNRVLITTNSFISKLQAWGKIQ